MLLRYLLLGLLLLSGAVRADIEVQQVESTEAPGVSQQSYVLVDKDSDRIVGQMVHIRTGLDAAMGRRFGPPDGGPMMVLSGSPLRAFVDQLALPSQLFAQMQMSRCAMLRQMGDDFSLLNQRLGARLAPLLLDASRAAVDGEAEGEGAQVEQLSADAQLQSLAASEAEQPAPLFGAEAVPGMGEGPAVLPPFQLQPMTWQQQAWSQPAQLMAAEEQGEEGTAEGAAAAADPFSALVHFLLGAEVVLRGEVSPPYNPDEDVDGWVPLEDTAVPTVIDEGVNWSFRNPDGSLNVGLLVFVILSAACVGVWCAGIASWLAYCRAMREAGGCCPARRCRQQQFLSSKSDLVKPLMPEGPLDLPKLYTGVEFAADHVENDTKPASLQ